MEQERHLQAVVEAFEQQDVAGRSSQEELDCVPCPLCGRAYLVQLHGVVACPAERWQLVGAGGEAELGEIVTERRWINKTEYFRCHLARYCFEFHSMIIPQLFACLLQDLRSESVTLRWLRERLASTYEGHALTCNGHLQFSIDNLHGTGTQLIARCLTCGIMHVIA